MNRFCRETGVGLIPWGPLYAGVLARPPQATGSTERSKGKSLTDADEKIVLRVKELADKKDWKMSQVALAWVDANVTSPIVGFSSTERMDDAIGTRGKVLSKEERQYLEECYVPKALEGHQN